MKVKYPRGTTFDCLRCARSWRCREDLLERPRCCGKCKSAFWDKPRQAVPHASWGAGKEPVKA